MTLVDDPAPGSTGAAVHPVKKRRRFGWRRGAIGVACGAALGVVALSLIVGPRLRSPQQLAADAAPPPPSLVTAQAERRSLVEPVVLRGTVRPGPSIALKPPVGATGESSVVTSVAVRTGQRLNEGQIVLVRSGEPMFAFALPFPLYRDLTPGSVGPDVEAVQRVLARLGYRTGSRGKFDKVTQQAVKRLYRDRGQRLPTATGDTDGADDPPDGDGRVDESSGPRPATSTGVTLARSAVVRIDRSGHRISRVRVRTGTVLTDSGKTMIELDGGRTYLEAKATAEHLPLLKKRQRASIVDDVTGARAKAEITNVGNKVVGGDKNGGESGFVIRFEFDGRTLPAAEDRTVRVDVAADTETGEVLAVPVTAVFSRPDGGTYLTVVRPGNGTSDVEVTTGKIAGGWVEIEKASPDVVRPGAAVVVSERNEAPAAEGSDGGG